MYIPSASVLDIEDKNGTNEETENEIQDDDDNDHNVDCNGRILRYETITMTSPVLSSSRLVSKRYITENDVNELNDKLQSLLLKTRNDEKEDDDDEEENTKIPRCTKPTKSPTKVPMLVELNKKDQASTTTYFGRCSLTIYNSMTNNFVEVVRSARLAFTSE